MVSGSELPTFVALIRAFCVADLPVLLIWPMGLVSLFCVKFESVYVAQWVHLAETQVGVIDAPAGQ